MTRDTWDLVGDEAVRAKGPGAVADDRVVACAAELFLREGIEPVKMADIANAAGVGVATVYRHFSTKSRVAVAAATLLWERFNAQIAELVESPEFLALDGLGRLRSLLERYRDAYCMHADFVAFLSAFDHMVVTQGVSTDELASYGSYVDSFYSIFEDAYRLGRADGSIAREVEFRPFYLALAHALMGVAQKMQQGEVIPSDDFSQGFTELQCLIDMALWSLSSKAPAASAGAQ
ncbi:MAG: TetR/AcrR family transcriptional regulator [Coriobacteriales bacterium]|nr:TetR/AcrR family transcriptional regulator [Coriobacteriales bacterium]